MGNLIAAHRMCVQSLKRHVAVHTQDDDDDVYSQRSSIYVLHHINDE